MVSKPSSVRRRPLSGREKEGQAKLNHALGQPLQGGLSKTSSRLEGSHMSFLWPANCSEHHRFSGTLCASTMPAPCLLVGPGDNVHRLTPS